MDGWQKNEIDFISNPAGINVEGGLKIKDYSITDISRTYWCFDLFPGWEAYTDASLLEVCTQQWLEAHKTALGNFSINEAFTFELFYQNIETFRSKLENLSGVDLRGFQWNDTVMSTEPPSQMRWLKRASIFKALAKHLPATTHVEVAEMQEALGYSMRDETWI